MALTPKDLKLSDDEITFAVHLERAADEFLRNNFTGGLCQYEVEVNNAYTERVVREVVKRYVATKGWKEVNAGRNQYGQLYIVFVPE